MCTSFLWLWAGPPGTVGPLGAKALRGAGGPSGGRAAAPEVFEPSGKAGALRELKALRAPGRAAANWKALRRRAGLPPSRYMTFYFTILCGFLCEKPVIGKERAVTRKPLASRTGPRRHGRGSSPPAIPFSFVRGHHVPRASGPSAVRTWCFTPSNPLFLRRRAPRLSGPAGSGEPGRGASLPASPYSFVRGHHVPRAQRPSALKTKAEEIPAREFPFHARSAGISLFSPRTEPARCRPNRKALPA